MAHLKARESCSVHGDGEIALVLEVGQCLRYMDLNEIFVSVGLLEVAIAHLHLVESLVYLGMSAVSVAGQTQSESAGFESGASYLDSPDPSEH